MALGKASLDDCPRFTSSLGCTAWPGPVSPASARVATVATTSFTFMLLWVPEPVCHTESGNSASNSPAATRRAASAMAPALTGSIRCRSRLTPAAAHLIQASEWINSIGMRWVPMAKKRWLRAVCAPHRASAGTSIGPKLSCSIRVGVMGAFGEPARIVGQVAGDGRCPGTSSRKASATVGAVPNPAGKPWQA